jgi:hypothetical protein
MLFLKNKVKQTRTVAGTVLSVVLLVVLSSAVHANAQTAGTTPQHTFFHVTLDHSFTSPVSGRLLLFVGPATDDASSVDVNMMAPASVYVAAKEIQQLAPGATVDIDADDLVFPQPLSQATAGSYRTQAVLDVHHSYNYDGRAPGDLLSVPVSVDLPLTASPTLTLTNVVPEPPDALAKDPEVSAAVKPIDFVSPLLTKFWGARSICAAGCFCLPTMRRIQKTSTQPYTSRMVSAARCMHSVPVTRRSSTAA